MSEFPIYTPLGGDNLGLYIGNQGATEYTALQGDQLALFVGLKGEPQEPEESVEIIKVSPLVWFTTRNIYCAPDQDKQYHFRLARVTKVQFPARNRVRVYGVEKSLPTTGDRYHVFTLSNIKPSMLNIGSDSPAWLKDTWRNLGEDMDVHNIIGMVYDSMGRIFPRFLTYYNFIDEHSLLICIRDVDALKAHFDYSDLTYFRTYSNTFFQTEKYNAFPVKHGVKYQGLYVNSVGQLSDLLNQKNLWEQEGGLTQTFLNGTYIDVFSLGFPLGSYVECVYDQSIVSKEVIPFSDFRAFVSQYHPNQTKYLVYREGNPDWIQYYDDNDFIFTGYNENNPRGLYYYRHTNDSISMVTDSSYALKSSFVDNHRQYLTNLFGTSVSDVRLTLFVRESGLNRPLVYSNMKLHELYKLPFSVQKEVVLGQDEMITDLRVETLESHPYMRLTQLSKMRLNDNQLSADALGYHATGFYFANNTVHDILGLSVDAPFLYRRPSTVIEYDVDGNFLDFYPSQGLIYIPRNPDDCASVEFISGHPTTTLPPIYNPTDRIPRIANEYRVYAVTYSEGQPTGPWVDITDTDYVEDDLETNEIVLVDVPLDQKVQVRFANRVLTRRISYPITDGLIWFPLQVLQDRGNGEGLNTIDIPFANIDIYLWGRKLVRNVDYFVDFPNIGICTKKYLDYTEAEQRITVLMYGFEDDPEKIDEVNSHGFISHGVLARDSIYDFHDDRVFSVFVDGQLRRRSEMIFAENDNQVRIDDAENGLPYSVREPYIPLRSVTGLQTDSWRDESIEKDKRLSAFFSMEQIRGEPVAPGPVMVIPTKHFVYSLTLSKIIEDIVDGNIPPSLYTDNYDHTTAHELIANYMDLYNIDPVKYRDVLPPDLVEIHPHIGNQTVSLNLAQYRFVDVVNQVLSEGRINLSGYLTISA